MPKTTLRRVTTSLLAVFCLYLVPSARGANYSEAVNGDLSGTPATPTAWLLQEGANLLTGSGGPDDMDVNDYDLVAFTVPVGKKLDSITVTQFAIDGRQSFFGLQQGSPWLDGLGNDVFGTYLLGYELVAESEVGIDLLQAMVNINDPNSFKPPLAGGVYTLLAQDTASPFSYTLTFNVSSVPEPTAVSVSAAGVVALVGASRRRRR